MTKQRNARRRASLYIMTLAGSMIVAVAGISAVMALRVQNRTAELGGDFGAARFYAHSAIELGRFDIHNDAAWRTTKSNGPWRTSQPFNDGFISLEAVDPADSTFSNDTSGHVLLTGTGIFGNARYKLAVELEPQGPAGMDCLASAIHTSTLLVTNAPVTADAPISSNSAVTVGLTSVVTGDIESVLAAVILGQHYGATTSGITPKEMPATTVFDYYIANALPIAMSALPINLLHREVRNAVLSPASNPYGGQTHPQGLYLLDCAGTPIRIMNTRVHGTLVILNPGLLSEISDGIHWERFDAQLPALLVKGSISFSWSANLLETTAPTTNFNPVGTPYGGVTDTDKADAYPSGIKGLIYVSGQLTVGSAAGVEGVIVTQGISLTVNDALTVTHDPSLLQSPPPGFERTNRPMEPIEGSWRQIVN